MSKPIENRIAVINKALETLRGNTWQIVVPTLVAPIAHLPVKLPQRVDLFRRCSCHGELSAAIYQLKWDGVSYEYASSIQVTQTLLRTQYGPGQQQRPVFWDGKWVKEETCPWCGVTTPSPYLCSRCGVVCAGLSTGEYFRCICGSEGWLGRAHIIHSGFVPRTAQSV